MRQSSNTDHLRQFNAPFNGFWSSNFSLAKFRLFPFSPQATSGPYHRKVLHAEAPPYDGGYQFFLPQSFLQGSLALSFPSFSWSEFFLFRCFQGHYLRQGFLNLGDPSASIGVSVLITGLSGSGAVSLLNSTLPHDLRRLILFSSFFFFADRSSLVLLHLWGAGAAASRTDSSGTPW